MIVILFIILQIEIVALAQVHTRQTKLTHQATMNNLGRLKKNHLDQQNSLNQKIQLVDICNQQIKTAVQIISQEITAFHHDLLSEISNRNT